ncbi:MAG: IS4/IS5 family transposase, partial [Erysipelotrichaceae bacterium]
MNNFKHLQRVLFKEVQYLNRFKSLFVENSKSDFVRKRKLSFDKTIMNIISLETGSLKDELLKLNNYAIDTPSTSAFVQARSKIRVEAFETLFKNFNS